MRKKKRSIKKVIIISIFLGLIVILTASLLIKYSFKLVRELTGKAIVVELGPELISCGDFSCGNGWIESSGWARVDNIARGGFGDLKQKISLESGKTYQVSFKVVSWQGKNAYLQPILGGTEGEKIYNALSGQIIIQNFTVQKKLISGSSDYGSQDYTYYQDPYFILRGYYGRGGSLSVLIEEVSVKEIKGEIEIPDILPNVTCYSNEDCGNATIIKFCLAEGNSSCTNSIIYACNKPGTFNSSCSAVKNYSCVECAFGCLNGSCNCAAGLKCYSGPYSEDKLVTNNTISGLPGGYNGYVYLTLNGSEDSYFVVNWISNDNPADVSTYIWGIDRIRDDAGRNKTTLRDLIGGSDIILTEVGDVYNKGEIALYLASANKDNKIAVIGVKPAYSNGAVFLNGSVAITTRVKARLSIVNLAYQSSDCVWSGYTAGTNGSCLGSVEPPVETGEFIGIGESNFYKLATSNTNTLLYDSFSGHRNFIVSWDNKAINNGTLTRLSESYWLAIDFSIDSISIREQTTGETAGDCENLSLGEKCYLGQFFREEVENGIPLYLPREIELTVKKLSTEKEKKFVELEINDGGSFNKVFDRYGNYMFLPELSELPTPNYNFNIFDKTDRPLEAYNFFLENGSFVSSGIGVKVYPDESSVKISCSTPHGYSIIDLLNESDKLAVSNTNTLVYNPKLGHRQFIVSSNPRFFPESYLLTVEFSESGTITLRERLDWSGYWDTVAGNCENLSLGKKCQIGDIELTVKKLSTEEKFVELEINDGGSFNKVFDYYGNYMFLPELNEIKEKDYVFRIFDKKNKIIRAINVYWDNGKINPLSSLRLFNYKLRDIILISPFGKYAYVGLLYSEIQKDSCGDGFCEKTKWDDCEKDICEDIDEIRLDEWEDISFEYNNEDYYVEVYGIYIPSYVGKQPTVRLYLNGVFTEALFEGQTRIFKGLPIYIKTLMEDFVELILGEKAICPQDCGGIKPEYRCKDSDNGTDYFKKGNITSESEFYEDYCQNEKRLTEYSCKSDSIFSEPYDCANGCLNGACVQQVYLIYNDNPSPKDVGLMQEFNNIKEQLEFEAGITKERIKVNVIKASETTKEMLDNSVSVFIYDGKVLVITGENTGIKGNVLAGNIESYLKYYYTLFFYCPIIKSSYIMGELIDNFCVPVDFYIYSCQKLDKKNKTYYLTKDLVGNEVIGKCIEITGENVVFDCQGHLIKNSDLRDAAIYSNADKVIIKNCRVEVSLSGGRGGSGIGVSAQGENNFIFNNTIENSYIGISTYGKENSLERNKFIGNVNGVLVNDNQNTLENNLIKSNKFGIFISGGDMNLLSNNKVYANEIGASFTSANPAFSRCENYNNSEYDFYLYPENWYNPFDRNVLFSRGSIYNSKYIANGTDFFESEDDLNCSDIDCFWKEDECIYFKDVCKDKDKDGYFDNSSGLCPYGTDCNDNNALVNPNRSEIPNNRIDDNCDGYAEDCPLGYEVYEATGKCDLQVISSASSNQENPYIYENKVVYQDDRNGNWDIYMYDLETGEETRITYSVADQINPKIYENKIVYQDNRNGNWDIYMVDLSEEVAEPSGLPDEGGFDFLGELPLEEIQITIGLSDKTNPSIYGNKIVWGDYRSKVCKDIYMYDLETREEFEITKCGSFLPRTNHQFPVIYDNIIVWNNGNRIYMCDLEKNGQSGGCLEDDEKMRIKSSVSENNFPSIHNNIIFWRGTGGVDYLFYCDLEKNGQSGGCLEGDSKITIDWDTYKNYENPFVYDNKLVWQQIENHKVNDIWIKAWEIYLCSVGRNGQQGGCLTRDGKVRITYNPSDQTNPSIYGNKLIWQDNRSGNWDIYGVDLSFLSDGKSENCEIPGDDDWSGLSDCADPVCGEGVYCNREHTKICNIGVCTPANEIRKCTTLTESGEYYLGKDLGEDELISSNCINIQAENVIFDCKGKSIKGLGETLIYSNTNNVIIKNCNLESVDGTGIKVEADNNLIENVNVSNSKLGIEVNGGYITLQNNNLENNFKGASIAGESAFIDTNTIKNNLEEGLIVEGSYSKISNNEIYNNKKGIVLEGSHTRLRCNDVFDNSEYDLEIRGASRDVVSIGDFEKKQIGVLSEFNIIEGSCEEIGISTKNMEKYSEKEAFLVSNKDWKQVLQLVPLSVWTGNEDCQKGTQTPEGVCVYPTLIYHEEGYAFDENPPENQDEESMYGLEVGSYWQEFVAEEAHLNKITLYFLANSNSDKVSVDIKDMDDNLIASSEIVNLNIDSSWSVEFPIEADLVKEEVYKFYINFLESSGAIMAPEFPEFNKPLYYFTNPGSIYAEGISSLGEDRDFPFIMDYEKDIADNFDADSIIYFLQQYSPNKVTIVGESPEEVDNLLIAEQDFGAGLEESQIQRINLEDYLSYWQKIGQIVYVEDNYEKALLASTYASLINSPLIIKGTELDDIEDCGTETCIFDNQNIILIGNVPCPKTAFYCEMYSLEKLQEKYVKLTGTTKTMLVNPQDLEIKDLFINGINTKISEINSFSTKTSLAAPFLASAKHEILLSVNKQDYINVNSFFKGKLSSLGLNPEYLTIVATPNAISYRGNPIDGAAADTAVYANLDSDVYPDLAVGRVMGLTTSDVSSYISRVLFYDDLEKTENLKFVAGGLTTEETEKRPLDAANLLAKKFKDAGYDSRCSININEYGCGTDRDCPISYESYECKKGYEPLDWIDQSFIAWIDHGQNTAAGIGSWDLPYLKSSVMFSKACATCAVAGNSNEVDKETFCNVAIRKGAIAYIGNIAGSDSGDWKVAGFLNGVYYNELPVGHAFKNSFNGYEYQRTTVLVGDPTLKIDVPYKLNTPLGIGSYLEWW